MVIDCDDCALRQTEACHDCVVTFILRTADEDIAVDVEEATALGNLAEAGLVPPLRLVPVERSSGPARRVG